LNYSQTTRENYEQITNDIETMSFGHHSTLLCLLCTHAHHVSLASYAYCN